MRFAIGDRVTWKRKHFARKHVCVRAAQKAYGNGPFPIVGIQELDSFIMHPQTIALDIPGRGLYYVSGRYLKIFSK